LKASGGRGSSTSARIESIKRIFLQQELTQLDLASGKPFCCWLCFLRRFHAQQRTHADERERKEGNCWLWLVCLCPVESLVVCTIQMDRLAYNVYRVKTIREDSLKNIEEPKPDVKMKEDEGSERCSICSSRFCHVREGGSNDDIGGNASLVGQEKMKSLLFDVRYSFRPFYYVTY
jgi:hypothetical protein